MTDMELLIEFCERFGYEYKIYDCYDCYGGGFKVYSQGEEYYFSPEGELEE